MSTANTDLLWTFLYAFYAVAAVAAVLSAVGIRMLVQDLRRPAARRAPVHPMPSQESATASVGRAA